MRTQYLTPPILVTVLSLVVATSCGSTKNPPSNAVDSSTRAAPSPTPPSTTPPSPTGAEAEVLRTYRKLQAAVTEVYARPRRSSTVVERYAADGELSEIYKTVLQYRQQRIRLTGKPRISPRVTSLDEQRKVASVVDCFDGSDWIPVDAGTGESVAVPDQNHRYRVTAQLRQLKGRWYVVSSTAHRGQKCRPG